MADQSRYHLLHHREEEGGTPNARFSSEQSHEGFHDKLHRTRFWAHWFCHGVAVVLALGSLGAIFNSGVWYGTKKTIHLAQSPYLKLEYNQANTMWWNTPFSNASKKATQAEIDEMWDTQIPWERGIIGIPYEEAEKLGLPKSNPWPWDGNKKGLYIMNAHHLLHCVRNLYISIQQFRVGTPQTIGYDHILHCLDSLRVGVMCHADDTLRYVPRNGDPADGLYPGDGQGHMCRDWSKISRFVEEHDPCYYYLEPENKELSNLDRFKFCKADSPYVPIIREYYGYSDDWVPSIPDGPRELQW